MKILITNGHVIVRDNASRGAVKSYKREMFKNVAIDTGTQKTTGGERIELDQAEEALDVVVYEMINEIVIDEKQIDKSRQFISDLDDEDFQKIATYCVERVLEAITQKKTSKTKSVEQSEDKKQST